MSLASNTSSQDRIAKALKSLQATRKLQSDRLNCGLGHVHLYVENVESDWLEQWGCTPAAVSVAQSQTRINLGRWFGRVFDVGWQTVGEVLGRAEANLAFAAFRGADDGRVRRAKAIDLGMQYDGDRCIVALVVTLTPEADGKIGILLQVYPTENQRSLSPALRLSVLSDSGEILCKAQPEGNCIQLPKMEGIPGERFSVEVSLGNVSITEDFAI